MKYWLETSYENVVAGGLAKQKAAQAWCSEATKKTVMDPDLCLEFAKILHSAISMPWLGNATTRELLEEIRTRIEIDGNLDYRTVDHD